MAELLWLDQLEGAGSKNFSTEYGIFPSDNSLLNELLLEAGVVKLLWSRTGKEDSGFTGVVVAAFIPLRTLFYVGLRDWIILDEVFQFDSIT